MVAIRLPIVSDTIFSQSRPGWVLKKILFDRLNVVPQGKAALEMGCPSSFFGRRAVQFQTAEWLG
jgi:hypothetical protein